ncbi:hypothetical protein SAMN05216343_10965 [Oscillibacter sp. PC13]|uniref:DUF554 domain-containing protein n=1 Tax=Oscillibacter sp. PC13 TaxID=1855299 RepID=UPI0008F05C28|nr:DUF554 domain-containing protein [Oscillibacter sp. PC13]SFP55305.1 hypothetical protein SAMN05216343_10965 [Oscillibacter sp. PC13]
MLTGSIVNALAILAGSAAGLLLKWAAGKFSGGLAGANNLGLRLQDIIMKGVALCVLYIGIAGCLAGENTLITIVSMVLGAILGELLDLDRRMHALGDLVQKKTERLVRQDDATASVSEGFVTASLLFCVGAMAIVGALQDGLTGDHTTLFAKSLLDGISAIVFSSSLGIGVAFSAVAVFLYQGTIAVLASFISPYLGKAVIAEMTCVGSLLIAALAFNMLGCTKIKVMNLVPACILPIFLCMVM